MSHWISMGVALLALTASQAYPQDDSNKSKETEKKAQSRKVDVRVKLSTMNGTPLPTKSMVEISGQEPACGSLNFNDAKETVDDKGEVMFHDLPACKVTIKVNLNQYLPKRTPVDLTEYKSCAPATPAKESGKSAAAQPPCEAISLVLEPIPQ